MKPEGSKVKTIRNWQNVFYTLDTEVYEASGSELREKCFLDQSIFL